jgi:hypothetical protein
MNYKISFCDACDESIPEREFLQQQTTIQNGRLYCRKCAPPAPRERSSVPGVLVLTILATMLGLIGLGYAGFEAKGLADEALRTQRAALAAANGDLSALAVRQDTALQQAHAADIKIAELELRVLATTNSSAENVKELGRKLDEESQAWRGALDQRLEQLEARVNAVLGPMQQQTQLSREDLAGQKATLESLKAEMGIVRELATQRAAPLPAGPAAEPPKPAEPMAAEPAVNEREINALILKLGDIDPGQRYTAVTELGRYTGPRVVSALEGLLKDPEEYLRVAVVQNLRQLGSKNSLPLILGALRDADPFVRSAAKAAFEGMAGTRLSFDPEATPRERETSVKEAEVWWEANKARVLGGS